MDVKFDFNNIMQQSINNALLKDENSKQLVTLANKYGIFGTNTINFIVDMFATLQQIKQDMDREEKENE